MSKKLKVVLDTNVLLISISSKSKFHWIFKKLLNECYDIVITNEIITEYFEIISTKLSVSVAKNVIRALLLLPNVHTANVYFKWNLINEDKDDNKFVDCAIASKADYIVTNDKHFNVLKGIEFPKVNVINVNEFRKIL